MSVAVARPGLVRRLLRVAIPAPVRRRVRGARRKVEVIRTYPTLQRRPVEALRYLVLGRELDNFTYELANEDELARFLEVAAGIPRAEAAGYLDELQRDTKLRSAIEAKLAGRSDRNRTMPYGRRLGWYALVRARKPRVVVETGVHDGLGSCVLLRALAQNAEEGSEGTLISFDPEAEVGWLVPPPLTSRYELDHGFAPEAFDDALRGRSVDIFIHDSDHRYEHETAEFEAILPRSAKGAVLITDNAHAGRAFRDFCDRHGLAFHFFHEAPRNHWYPGAGIGLAIR